MDDVSMDAEAVEPRVSLPDEEVVGSVHSSSGVGETTCKRILNLEIESVDEETTQVRSSLDVEQSHFTPSYQPIQTLFNVTNESSAVPPEAAKESMPLQQDEADEQKPVLSDVTMKPWSAMPDPDESMKILPVQSNKEVNLIPPQSEVEIPPDPPLEWRLNDLLLYIAERIDENELAKIKTLFRGEKGIGKRTLEKCDTCLKLFEVMRNHTYILRGNITYLNRILYTLNRPDLIERVVQYCREEGNVVYYYSQTEESETGDTSVTFHIVTDVRNSEAIERLRNNVAKIVCAPLEQVRIAAVEPGSSLLVTLKMPEMYANILQRLLKTKADLWELRDLQVDTVVIADKLYDLTGRDHTEIDETEQQRKLQNIYDQFAATRQMLEATEAQNLDMKVKLQDMQQNLERLTTQNQELRLTISSLKEINYAGADCDAALYDLLNGIKLAKKQGLQNGLLSRLLNANSRLVSAHLRNKNEIELENENKLWKSKQMKEEQLRHLLITEEATPEQVLLLKYSQCTLVQDLGLDMRLCQCINDVSERITEVEKSKLMERYDWTEQDVIKRCIDADTKLLLLGLECKETERQQTTVMTGAFLEEILGDIDRHDLLAEFYETIDRIESDTRSSEKHTTYLSRSLEIRHQNTIDDHYSGQTIGAENELQQKFTILYLTMPGEDKKLVSSR